MSDFSFLISSCDNFSDLWINLDVLYKKNFRSNKKIFLLTEKVSDSIPRSFIPIISNSEFSERLKIAIESIDSKYIFLTLDDYLPTKIINVNKISQLISFLDCNNGDYCRVFKTPKFGKIVDKNKKIKHLPLSKSCYEVNLYPGIWRKDSLRKVLDLAKEENPWQFEVMMTSRSKTLGLNCFSCSDNRIFPFIDTIRKGKYLRRAYKFLEKNNLYISDRKKRSLIETIRLGIKVFVGKIVPMPIVRLYRKSRFNKSYSSYANRKGK